MPRCPRGRASARARDLPGNDCGQFRVHYRDTTPIAEAVAKRLKAEGFPEADIFVGGAHPNKANVVVRYRGTGRLRPILLLAHTDVVEAKREDWTMDPFTLIEKDGYFYGRGTGDDKAQAAIWVANLIRYKREGFKPARDIIVALTADEEGGGPYNGVEWLLREHRDLIDAEFSLNEGGWGEMENGKRLSNNIQVARSTSSTIASRSGTRAATARFRFPTTRSTGSPRARPAVAIRLPASDQ
jgi:acetylornithine deacetylase/succinyl-diaminopimelate desuccinylase-like protein